MLRQRLEGDGVHDERDELGHLAVHVRLVQLVHEHHDDWQLREHLQRQPTLRYDVVLRDRRAHDSVSAAYVLPSAAGTARYGQL